MALKDFEFCDAHARESLATGLGRGVSRSITDDACWRIRADFEEMPDLTVTTAKRRAFGLSMNRSQRRRCSIWKNVESCDRPGSVSGAVGKGSRRVGVMI